MQNPAPRRRTVGALVLASIIALGLTSSAWAQKVRLATSMGDIVVELDPAKAPKSVENFVQYVKAGHYDGTIFHRVIDGFMIQGGGYSAERVQKPTRAPIPLEAGNGLSNLRGTIAMARTAAPNSATSQFFINVVDNLPLDSYGGGYAVFGKVVAGMDVVDRIKAVPTTNKGPAFANLPATDVVINKATLED
ncbi:MAG TPA: peptidylprolyl isomerase [Rubrivivax sp.]|nr:peptidyl-prolyl cis-trans isomerase [Burkholderiales bacterium]HNU09812.1 peptidylprolyl isomerase [Rubrivivax sp.]